MFAMILLVCQREGHPTCDYPDIFSKKVRYCKQIMRQHSIQFCSALKVAAYFAKHVKC